jgi:hypothetical protein
MGMSNWIIGMMEEEAMSKKKKAVAPKIKTVTKIKQPDALAETYQEVDETMSKIDSIMDRVKAIVKRGKRIAKWK